MKISIKKILTHCYSLKLRNNFFAGTDRFYLFNSIIITNWLPSISLASSPLLRTQSVRCQDFRYSFHTYTHKSHVLTGIQKSNKTQRYA